MPPLGIVKNAHVLISFSVAALPQGVQPPQSQGMSGSLSAQHLVECVWEDALLLKLYVVMATEHSAIAAERGDSGSCDHWERKMSQPFPSVSLRHLSPATLRKCEWGVTGSLRDDLWNLSTSGFIDVRSLMTVRPCSLSVYTELTAVDALT